MGNLNAWDKVMNTALSMPSVKVRREEYLKDVFKGYGNTFEIESKRPIELFDSEIVSKVADSTIKNHLLKVTSISTISGIPGGPSVFATIPADIAQFYYHTMVLAQKLAYIYGYPNLLDDKNNVTEDTRNNITLFIGVMMGTATAQKAVSKLSTETAKQVAKRLPQKALTKTSYYPIAKNVGKWIGLKVTKESFGKGLGKTIPILGGVLSGGMTYASFRPMAKRLKKQLESDMQLIQSKNLNTIETQNFISEIEEPKINLEYTVIETCINIAKIDFELHENEVDFITNLIDESDLTENEKMSLLKELHQKEVSNIDFSIFKGNDLYSTALIERIIQVVKIDNIIKPAEKIYLFKIASELGFSREDIKEMLAEETM